MRRYLLILLLLVQSPVAWSAPDVPQASFTEPVGDTGDRIRVTIMPFDTPRGQPALAPYGEGTMDSLIAALSNVPKFVMVDRGRIDRVIQEQARGKSGLADNKLAVAVAKSFRAQSVVAGSIVTAGREVMITAHFTDVETGQIKASERVRGPLTSIFDLQQQLAFKFIAGERVAVTADQQQRVTQVLKSTTNLSAYDLYLQGRKEYLTFHMTGYPKAIEAYNHAIATDPAYALAYVGQAETWLMWGWQGQIGTSTKTRRYYAQAYDAAQQALKLNRRLPDAHRAAGVAGATLGKPDWQDELRLALILNPNDAEAWYSLWNFTHGDDPDHAYIRRAIELNPDLAIARVDRGIKLHRRGRMEEALQEYREALRANPRYPVAHNAIGLVYFAQDRIEDAAAEFRKAIALNPDYARGHHRLAQALAALGRHEEALAEFQQADRLSPNSAEVRNGMARAYGSLARWAEAASQLKAVLQLDPGNKEAQQLLEQAQQKLNAR